MTGGTHMVSVSPMQTRWCGQEVQGPQLPSLFLEMVHLSLLQLSSMLNPKRISCSNRHCCVRKCEWKSFYCYFFMLGSFFYIWSKQCIAGKAEIKTVRVIQVSLAIWQCEKCVKYLLVKAREWCLKWKTSVWNMSLEQTVLFLVGKMLSTNENETCKTYFKSVQAGL